MAHPGNPYHDAKGLFATGPGGMSAHMEARLQRSFGSTKEHIEASFVKPTQVKKQLSAEELSRLRSKFGKIVKG